MIPFPLAQWADKEPGRWILVWCALFALWIIGASVSPSESKPQVKPTIAKPVQVSQLDQLQQQVGPEGTCEETAKKVICKNKHGQKVINKAKE